MTVSLKARQHIQDFSNASILQHHWGYNDRVIPCANDRATCEYLDLVYGAHDRGLIYVGILWATIITALSTMASLHLLRTWLGRRESHESRESPGTGAQGSVRPKTTPTSVLALLFASAAAATRRHLLPDIGLRRIFGRVTRFQVLVAAMLAAYLVIWSFLGMTFRHWITPAKNYPGVYSTRSTLGPFADRMGMLAFALTPLSVLLGSRESVLTLMTGIPSQRFNFLHRFLGHIIFIQSSVHTMGWCIVEMRLYQPQPTVFHHFIREPYIIWGVTAIVLLGLLWALSLPISIRLFGYEFFRKAHYGLAMLYVGACWGHWARLKVFLIPSLAVWALDRGARLARTAMLHFKCLPNVLSSSQPGRLGFYTAPAQVIRFADAENGDVVRLDFELVQRPWAIGKHFYLTFVEGSIWQAHPFTPLSVPVQEEGGVVRHSYLIRARAGETKRVAELAATKCTEVLPVQPEDATTELGRRGKPTLGVILTGPYGVGILDRLDSEMGVLCLAGGTGITFVLPVLFRLAATADGRAKRAKLSLCWMVRREQDASWVEPELEKLCKLGVVHVRIFATGQGRLDGSSPGQAQPSDCVQGTPGTPGSEDEKTVTKMALPATPSMAELSRCGRPDVKTLIDDFVASVKTAHSGRGLCRCTVVVSGPGGMISDARAAVAACNSGRRVLLRRGRRDEDVADVVRLVEDDRLEIA